MEQESFLYIAGYPPVNFEEITQNIKQPWITPLKYEPGEEYKMRGGKRVYIADKNGALHHVS